MATRILVVDDEKNVLEYLKMELEEANEDFEVITALTGYQALKYIFNNGIGLLLTDIAMPDMDGYELFKRIREHNENIPIIMMTGFGYDPDHVLVNTKKAGLQDVIFKPFDIKKLIKLIKKRLHEN
ncbi:MAG: response regulator [Candidatus Cloacimonadota bacterium]|nr:response regulator [Candidatus Cloacimonadota bacterium]